MVKILDNITYRGKEYTYVDKFMYNKSSINCYLSDEDYLFSVIKDGKEVFIEDKELIYMIKEQEGLNPPEVYYKINPLLNLVAMDMTEMEKEKVGEIKAKFFQLIRDSDINVSADELLQRLSKVSFIEGIPRNTSWVGLYQPASNSIVVKNGCDFSTVIHELVHACGLGMNKCSLGLKEGGTELTTRKLLKDIDSTFSEVNGLLFDGNLYVSYPLQVAIMKQMEYLLNDSVSESLLLGKDDFFNKFKDKYGNKIFRYITHRSTRLINMYYKNGVNCTKYFLETQKKLFETVFDIEIKNVNSIESANAYLQRMSKFELLLGIDPKNENATGFVEYYEKKLLEIKKLLEEKNVSKEDIDRIITFNKHISFPIYTHPEMFFSSKKH